jgi:FkbM family methyltransferase
MSDVLTREASDVVCFRGQSFRTIRHGAVAHALDEFRSPFEAGTLHFFDSVLSFCDRMIDVGAYVGLMSLYAAGRVRQVCAFEASPTNFALLARNVAANPGLRERIRLFGHGLGERDAEVPLYRKAVADSGSSIFRTIERRQVLHTAPEGMVTLRAADAALREAGLDERTLLKIDIEGAEYQVIPAIAGLLAEARPFLHLSFHPFNLVAGPDPYLNSVMRLRCALQVAEAVAPYRYMYFHEADGWQRIGAADRSEFLRHYLLRPKPLPHIATRLASATGNWIRRRRALSGVKPRRGRRDGLPHSRRLARRKPSLDVRLVRSSRMRAGRPAALRLFNPALYRSP